MTTTCKTVSAAAATGGAPVAVTYRGVRNLKQHQSEIRRSSAVLGGGVGRGGEVEAGSERGETGAAWRDRARSGSLQDVIKTVGSPLNCESGAKTYLVEDKSGKDGTVYDESDNWLRNRHASGNDTSSTSAAFTETPRTLFERLYHEKVEILTFCMSKRHS